MKIKELTAPKQLEDGWAQTQFRDRQLQADRNKDG